MLRTFEQCSRCRHNRFAETGDNLCAAFPVGPGIPVPILYDEHDHRHAYPGDSGVRFEPLPGERHPADDPPATGSEAR